MAARLDRGTSLTLSQLRILVALALPVAIALAIPLSSVDLAYQLRAGDLMLQTHHVIRSDNFTFTAAGHSWVDQQWGAQVLLTLLYRAGRWTALGLARAALVAVVFALMFRACRAAGASSRRAAWLTLAAFFVGIPGLVMRPQLFGTVLFALTLWIVADRRRNPGRLWAVPAITAVWANLHGSFVLAPLLLLLASVEDRHERSPLARRAIGLAGASVVAATLNPFGFRIWSYVTDISTSGRIRSSITEWQPPSIRDPAGAIFLISGLLVAALLLRGGRPAAWPSLLWLGTFFVLGLLAVRNVSWWALAAPMAVAAITKDDVVRTRTDPTLPVVNNALAAALVLALAFSLVPWFQEYGRDIPTARVLSDAPAGITEELHTILEPGERFFNPQRWGSWFEFALPRNRVFTDSRIEVFSDRVWLDNTRVSRGQQGWQGILDRWVISVVVAEPGQQAGLLPRIRNDPSWRMAYHDHAGSIFVRR